MAESADACLWSATMKSIFASSPFNNLLGLKLDEAGSGAATITLTLQPDHFNPLGIAHGGLIATGLDCALIQSVRSCCKQGDQQTTVEMKVNYLEPVKSERICFKGTVVRMGKRICVAQAEALDGSGLRVAIAMGTVAVHRRPAAERA